MIDIEIVSGAEAHGLALTAKPKRRRLQPDPERLNKDRAKSALAALKTFRAETGAEEWDAVSDLTANLMHFCDRHPQYGDRNEEVGRGIDTYLEDTAQQGLYVEFIDIR